MAAVAAACLLLPACSAPVNKAGGTGVTTLRLALDDPGGRETGREVEEFARQVRQHSGGRLRVAVTYQANGVKGVRAWDQQIAKKVRAGTFPLGLVPARAWDELGVRTFEPLTVPFLVSTDAQLDAVVADPAASSMLQGVRRLGVTGLAMFPEAIRHPAGFSTTMVSPSDFAGQSVWAPLSALTYDTFRALGAKPSDIAGPALTIGVAHGEITGAETSIDRLFTLPTPNTITANIPLYAKANVLVISTKAFQSLDGDERAAVRAAADAAVQRIIATRVTDAQQASDLCTAGGTIVIASTSDLAAVREAVAPVRDRVQADSGVRPILARVAHIVARHPGRSLSKDCGRPVVGAPAARDLVDPGVLNGVWRFTLSREEILGAGLSSEVADRESGVSTIRMDGGTYSWDWTPPIGPQTCKGHYQVTKTSVTFREEGDNCGGWSAADYRLDGKQLFFRSGHSLNEGDHDAALLDPLWFARPWQLVSPL